MKLALGPIQYYWPRETVFAFYRVVSAAPVDVVYLGETVCSRRHEIRLGDWLDIAAMLTDAGKETVLSTQVLLESESDLKAMRRIVRNGRYTVEANDMGAVRLLTGTPFVAGASLNIYNSETLAFVRGLGAQRWIPPVEMSQSALASLQRPAGMETELFAYGRLPLAYSARCFTARRFNLQKDDCRFRCLDFPEGLPVHTREHEPLFVLNGVQTLSARVCNLVRELPRIRELGIDVLRVSPPRANAAAILELFKNALRERQDIDSITAELERVSASSGCDGFWHDAPGMQRVHTRAAN